jgi:hypothetical protein
MTDKAMHSDHSNAVTRKPLSLTINYVLVIEWLPEGEHKTGALLCEHFNSDVISPVSFAVVKCKKAADVLVALDVALQRARKGEIPLIQIEAHGFPRVGSESGGIEGPGPDTSERILWDQLWEKFREINAASGYQLVVAASACYGGDAKWGIVDELLMRFDGRPETVLPIPFMACVGFASGVSSVSLLRAFVRFYQALFRGDSPERACRRANGRLYARERMVWTSSDDVVRRAVFAIHGGRPRADARAKWHQMGRRPIWLVFRAELLDLEKQNMDMVRRQLLPYI